MRPKIIWGDLIWSEICVFVARRIMFGRPTLNLCMHSNNRVMSVQTSLQFIFNDILHMSFLAGTHVFKAFPAYTTTEL